MDMKNIAKISSTTSNTVYNTARCRTIHEIKSRNMSKSPLSHVKNKQNNPLVSQKTKLVAVKTNKKMRTK